MRNLTAGILALIALDAAAAAQTPASLKASVPHITASGYASADVVPDEATLSLAILRERSSAEAASADMAAAGTAVVAECKKNGVAQQDIKTAYVNLTRVYDDERDASGRLVKHTLRAYQASETLTIRVRDVRKAGALAQSLIEKGANQFNSISFDYSKEREKRRELRAAAMRDALAEAQSYTDAIGLELGRVLQIGDDPSEGDGVADLPARAPPPKGKSVSLVAIPVEPGVETISVSVSVTWEIESRRR